MTAVQATLPKQQTCRALKLVQKEKEDRFFLCLPKLATMAKKFPEEIADMFGRLSCSLDLDTELSAIMAECQLAVLDDDPQSKTYSKIMALWRLSDFKKGAEAYDPWCRAWQLCRTAEEKYGEFLDIGQAFLTFLLKDKSHLRGGEFELGTQILDMSANFVQERIKDLSLCRLDRDLFSKLALTMKDKKDRYALLDRFVECEKAMTRLREESEKE